MMTVCPVSTVVAAYGACDVTFTTVTASGISEECTAAVNGAQGPVDLLVQSVTGEITVTLLRGDGPTAAGERTYVVPSGGSMCITVSTGETVCADGTVRFRLEAEGAFSTLRPKIAVIRRLNSVTH